MIDCSVREYPEAKVIIDFSYCEIDELKCPYALERLVLNNGGNDNGNTTNRRNSER